MYNSKLGSGFIINGKVKNSLISRGVKIQDDALIEESLVFTNSEVKSGAQVKFAIIDKGVVVENNVKIIGSSEKPVVIPKGTVVTADIL